jgi:hypothetical protein
MSGREEKEPPGVWMQRGKMPPSLADPERPEGGIT